MAGAVSGTTVKADDFLRLSKALKKAGDTEMRKELNKRMRAAAKPLIPMTRAAAVESLPTRGGLAKVVSKAPQRVKVSTGAKTAGVSIHVPRGSAAWGANQGVVRHPVFGKPNSWVEQRVPKGWFDLTLEREGPKVAEGAIREALEDITRQIIGEVR